MSANIVEGHCLQTMKIVHYNANGCFDWLNFWAAELYSFERSNFYTVWEIQKIYVCPSCGKAPTVEKVKNQSTKQSAQVIFGVKA